MCCPDLSSSDIPPCILHFSQAGSEHPVFFLACLLYACSSHRQKHGTCHPSLPGPVSERPSAACYRLHFREFFPCFSLSLLMSSLLKTSVLWLEEHILGAKNIWVWLFLAKPFSSIKHKNRQNKNTCSALAEQFWGLSAWFSICPGRGTLPLTFPSSEPRHLYSYVRSRFLWPFLCSTFMPFWVFVFLSTRLKFPWSKSCFLFILLFPVVPATGFVHSKCLINLCWTKLEF